MKPKTKIQRRVLALSQTLAPMTEGQLRWALDNAFERTGYVCLVAKRAWCSCCGHEFDTGGQVSGEIACPHCGRKITLKVARNQKYDNKVYYTLMQVCKEWQVVRHFVVRKTVRKGGKLWISADEAVQHWVDGDGHHEVVARRVNNIGHCYDNWCFGRPMEIREPRVNDWGINKYSIGGTWVYPHRGILGKARRNGYSGKLANSKHIMNKAQDEVVRALLQWPDAEMLAKTRQLALLGYMVNNERQTVPHRHAVCVCNRNGYRIEDASMWVSAIVGKLSWLS